MAKRIESIQIQVYLPKTPEGKADLAERIANVHARLVARRIQELNCPLAQKLALSDAVVRTARDRARAEEPER